MLLICPTTSCRAENDTQANVCARCGTPLAGYARLLAYPSLLFNQGLTAVRSGQLARARDLFAAVVHWCPMDSEAHNALAMACLALNDQEEARRHWELVLGRAPADPIAVRGLAMLAQASAAHTPTAQRRGARTDSAKPREPAKPKRKRAGKEERHAGAG